ncbi:MAG: hypothetical protein A3G91_04570 [Omnitrophica WOR_2 bacterium RIFCSPLOWO2_12_FULL_50_9]|nr:MAG: hypothetical protein A3D87_03820 [Omnitrophica WOR_2 bacterium RIFCSPHIGHO2_02_FULL_50_17]OGX40829.1 MAG: hypothetical protein A3G91_04570 [Omnitrophica WOR_2 bacterium RIFCSPLOWO2_12_FULL_50_9]
MELTEKQISSEEKLLRLIRKKSAPVKAGRRKKDERVPGISGAGGGEAEGNARRDFLDVSNRVLAVAAAGIFLSLVLWYSLKGRLTTEDMTLGDGAAEKIPVWEQGDISDPRPFDFYDEEIAGRDFFQNPWQKSEGTASSLAGSASEIGRQLKLVGILLDNDPKAIIEDAATQQTFFVSTGERIGEALVEEIREDKVILIFHEEKVELVP